MAEIITIGGFVPERLSEAIDLVSHLDCNALVFKGMARGVHDRMVELHKAYYRPDQSNKFINEPEITGIVRDLGWDIDCLRNQVPPTPVWPLNAIPATTVELVAPGKGISWHNDVTRAGTASEVCLPVGVGVSINLVSPALFRVARTKVNLDVGYNLPQSKIDALAAGASVEMPRHEDKAALEAVLEPADVIAWKQPTAHEVWMYELDTNPDDLRRAVVFIEEDIVSAVDS